MIAKHIRGYTVIEVVVIIAIIAVASVIAFNLAGGERPAKFGQDFDELEANLRQLQSDARAAKGNEEYGMCFEPGGWTSFSIPSGTVSDPCPPGAGQQLRSENFRVASLNASVSNASDWIAFERVTGRTRNGAHATLTLKLGDPERTRVLKVEASGAVHEE